MPRNISTRRGIAIVTSQAPCGVGGEHVHRLAPLALPAPGADAAAAAGAAAVELFVARARALVGDFRLDDGNTGTVVELCRRLDGLPLALELAAGRLPALGLAALADGLEQRFRVLAAARPGTPERQRTLEAVLDWSYGLLGDDERAVFRRLGLLGATFTLEDAVAVGGDAALDAWAVAAIVGDLVDRSLVVALASEPPVYTLLETGRAYARTRLAPATDGPHIARAIDHLERDALRAAAASDNARALRMASAALELAGLLPAGADRDTRELELGIALGPVLQTTVGPAHPRTEAVYRRASQLAAGRPADERAFMAQWGLWQFLSMAGRDAEAATHTDAIVRTAGALGDEALVLEAHHARLTTWQLLGRAPEAVASAREVIARYDRDRHHALAFRFGGHDPGACALGQGAVALWLAGRPDEAADLATRALALGESMDHAYSRGCAYFYAAFTWCALGRDAEFDRATTALAALCERHTMDMLSNEALLLGGRARWRRGDAAGIADMERALDTIDAGGDYAFAILYATLLVDALIATGRWDDAAGRMTGAAAYSRDGQRFFLPELARLSGELRAARGDRDAAAADFAVALAQAREDGAAALALRAATSAAAHAAPAARDAALAALRDARALIEGGTTTPDVRRADALLAGATAAPPRRRR